jgi:hypothetical protein
VALLAVMLATTPVAWSKDANGDTADSDPSSVASVWFDKLYDLVKSEGTPPPAASRIYGVAAVSLYEAIVSGTEEHRSLVGQLNGLRQLPRPEKGVKYHWPTVANAALAQTIRGIFTSLKAENLAAVNALGGNAIDQGYGIVLDAETNAYVAGNTASTDLPTTPGAFDTTFNGSFDNPAPRSRLGSRNAIQPGDEIAREGDADLDPSCVHTRHATILRTTHPTTRP